jgi:hypothetical protein
MLRNFTTLINSIISMDKRQEGESSTVSTGCSLTRQAEEHAHPSPVPTPTTFPLKISSDLGELQKWPKAFRGEQLLHLLRTSDATGHVTSMQVRKILFFL